MTNEAPQPNPELIDRIPTQEELEARRMDPRLSETLSRGALDELLAGSTDSAAELNARNPLKLRAEQADTSVEPAAVQAVEQDLPVVPEHYRTTSAEQMRALREQIIKEDQ